MVHVGYLLPGVYVAVQDGVGLRLVTGLKMGVERLTVGVAFGVLQVGEHFALVSALEALLSNASVLWAFLEPIAAGLGTHDIVRALESLLVLLVVVGLGFGHAVVDIGGVHRSDTCGVLVIMVSNSELRLVGRR